MRFSKHTPIDRQDEIDGLERQMRSYLDLKDGKTAGELSAAFNGEVEEHMDLWSRFAPNERSAMKERRDVRKGRGR